MGPIRVLENRRVSCKRTISLGSVCVYVACALRAAQAGGGCRPRVNEPEFCLTTGGVTNSHLVNCKVVAGLWISLMVVLDDGFH